MNKNSDILKSRIRVLRIIARMNIGGPAVQITGLMQGLESSKFQQRLVTGYCEKDEADYLDSFAKEIEVERISGFGKSLNFIEDLKVLIKIIIIIREFRPHVIHTHTTKAGVIGRVASLLSGITSYRVHTYHGHLLNGYFSNYKIKLLIFIERFLAYFTHKIVSVGNQVKQDLLNVEIGNENKYVIIPPGMNSPNPKSREVALSELNLSSEKIYCLFLGRVTKIKRPDRLIRVVEIIKSRGVEIQFLIAGSGDLLDSAKKEVVRNNLPVTFLGWRNDIDTLFGLSDMLLLTSDNEGTPLSVVQAQMAGVPVVATNVGSTSEVMLNGVSGFLTSLDPNEIADQLELLAKNKFLRSSMGESGMKYTSYKFSYERLVLDHSKLYLELVTNQAIS
jgi:glycosyltransferase involved in cell wall biosynthesis